MRKAKVFMLGKEAGVLEEIDRQHYRFTYLETYEGPPVSLTMPIHENEFQFDTFPPFFDGVLPEGGQLNALLKTYKIDADDYFSQLLMVGQDLVGAVTVEKY